MRFGSSGIRAVYSRELVECALALGSALGERPGVVLLGHDTRTSSPVISRAFASGTLSRGGCVLLAGLVPTPALAHAVPDGAAGCMVTASHNPPEFNGMKVFSPGGASFTRTRQQEIEVLLGERLQRSGRGDPSLFGQVEEREILSPYIRDITGKVSCARKVKVVLDCGGGAGSVASPHLLAGIGADVRAINCSPTGFFPRPSEPSEEALAYIGALVRRWGADGAVVHDGDADRMAAFDSRGRYIPGDTLLILFARFLGARKVVTTTDASMAIDDWADVTRTPVGDSYVSEALLSGGDFGGEPSGAWIFPRHSLCPDGPFAAALFCQMASEWDIAGEVDAIPRYPVLRTSVHCTRSADVLVALGADVPTDGIRVEREDGWYLVRASGTEPKIRVTAEGKTTDAAKALLDEGLSRVKKWKKEISRE
ncbi:MAG: phosphoglucomutase [Methanolinea sp.]|nr:phosphoglucomutase [Methanolinea sp.]